MALAVVVTSSVDEVTSVVVAASVVTAVSEVTTSVAAVAVFVAGSTLQGQTSANHPIQVQIGILTTPSLHAWRVHACAKPALPCGSFGRQRLGRHSYEP